MNSQLLILTKIIDLLGLAWVEGLYDYIYIKTFEIMIKNKIKYNSFRNNLKFL